MEKIDIVKEFHRQLKPFTKYEDWIQVAYDFTNSNLRTYPTEIQRIIDSIVHKVENEGDLKALGVFFLLRGWTQTDLGNYRVARNNFRKSINLFQKTDYKIGIIRAYNSLAFCSTSMGDLAQAFKYYDQALELADEIRANKEFNSIYINLAETWQIIGDDHEAIKYFKKALSANPRGTSKAIILEGLGASYHHLGKSEKALPYLFEALGIANSENLILVRSHVLSTLGSVYENLGQAEEAIELLETAKKLALKADLPKFAGDSHLALGRLYMHRGDNEKALSSFKKALRLAQTIKEVPLSSEARKCISDLYRKMGKWKEAYTYFVDFYDGVENLADEEIVKEIQKLKFKEAQREIELLKEMHQQISTISKMGKEITSSLDLKRVMLTIAKILSDLMDTTKFGVGIYNEDEKEILLQWTEDDHSWCEPVKLSLDNNCSFTTRCFKSNKEIIINDSLKKHAKYAKGYAGSFYPDKDIIQSLICLPLRLGDRPIGIITVQSPKKNAYDEYKVEMFKALASYIAIAIENSKLYKKVETMAINDPVTNLYSRAHFIDLAEKEFLKYKREQTHFSLIMFDLDHFKEINDQYGHAVGDTTLQEVAKICEGRLRKSDLFSRYGGDEFMILLPQAGLGEAELVAENLRKSLAKTRITLEDKKVFSLTASFGTVCAQANDSNLKDILKRADLALYESKHAGRNKVSSSFVEG